VSVQSSRCSQSAYVESQPDQAQSSQIQNRKFDFSEAPYPPTAIGVKFGVCFDSLAMGAAGSLCAD